MAPLRGLSRAAATMVVGGVLIAACGGEADPNPARPEAPPTVQPQPPKPPPGGEQTSKDRGGAKEGGGDRSGGGSGRSEPRGGGEAGSGSGRSERTGGSYDSERPDAEGNDVPPPPGSPAERFERTCERNPRDCY